MSAIKDYRTYLPPTCILHSPLTTGFDHGLDDPACLHIRQRPSHLFQPITVRNQRRPVHLPAKSLQYLHRAVDVREVRPPTPTDLQMLPIDVRVWVQRNVTVVRVLADDDVATGIANDLASFQDRLRIAAGLDDDIRPTATGRAFDGSGTYRGRGFQYVHGPVRAHGLCRLQSRRRRPQDAYPAGSAKPGESGSTQSDRATALNQHAVSEADLCQLDGMHRRGQAAAASDPLIGRNTIRQAYKPGSRPQVDPLRPATGQAGWIFRAQGNSIDTAMRAAGRGFGDQAVPAGVTGTIHVQEGDHIAHLDLGALNILHISLDPLDLADADVTGNERVGDSGQPPVL